MWPFELVATATDSPRYSPGGSFSKFGTDENGMSRTFSIVALRCANEGAAASNTSVTEDVRILFIEVSWNCSCPLLPRIFADDVVYVLVVLVTNVLYDVG